MGDQISRSNLIFTWVVFALALCLIVWGILLHGFSLDIHHRLWSDMSGRFGGPMTFRFFLQPIMAAIAALIDGLRDVREGHRSFFWSAILDRSLKRGRLKEGLVSTARIVLLGISMDIIYQMRVLDDFYPAEAVLIAILLAIVPYFVFRWIVEMVGRRWRDRRGASMQ